MTSTVSVSWCNERVFFPGMMSVFIDHVPEEAVQIELWDWFKLYEEPSIDYFCGREAEEVDFIFQDEDVTLLFKLTFG